VASCDSLERPVDHLRRSEGAREKERGGTGDWGEVGGSEGGREEERLDGLICAAIACTCTSSSFVALFLRSHSTCLTRLID